MTRHLDQGSTLAHLTQEGSPSLSENTRERPAEPLCSALWHAGWLLFANPLDRETLTCWTPLAKPMVSVVAGERKLHLCGLDLVCSYLLADLHPQDLCMLAVCYGATREDLSRMLFREINEGRLDWTNIQAIDYAVYLSKNFPMPTFDAWPIYLGSRRLFPGVRLLEQHYPVSEYSPSIAEGATMEVRRVLPQR